MKICLVKKNYFIISCRKNPGLVVVHFHADWAAECQPMNDVLSLLVNDNELKVSNSYIITERKLSYSFVRMQPLPKSKRSAYQKFQCSTTFRQFLHSYFSLLEK